MRIPILPMNFDSENEVEHYYSHALCDLLECAFKSRFFTDGTYDSDKFNLKVLGEYKCEGNLLTDNNLFNRCTIQEMCYIKKIENAAEKLPDVIFTGTGTHFAIFDSSILSPYLKFVNSSMKPRQMFDHPPPQLMRLLANNFHVQKYNILDLPLIQNLIHNYKGKTTGLKMSITDNNIVRIFENFITSNILVSKLNDNELVALFAEVIFGECDDITNKPHQLVTPLKNKRIIKINRDKYDAFSLSIKSITRPSDKKQITSQADILINEVSRRFRGEFYTPKIWVDKALKMIEQQFGSNWENDYVFWDPPCGTANLTRDSQFKELYCSTLHQSDIDIMNQRNYNDEAVKFQYDFLNDDVYPPDVIGLEEDKLKKLAPGLVKALEENKPIIIFMNPPYGVAGDYYMKGKSKKEIANTRVKEHMTGMAAAPQNIYTQFLYRIIMLKRKYNLENINIVSFTPITFITKPSYKKFREEYFNEFEYKDSFMLSVEEFNGTVGSWPIILSVWKTGKTLDPIFTRIKSSASPISKEIYNTDDGISGKEWTSIPSTIEAPILTNPLTVKQELFKGWREDSIAYFTNDSNDVSSSLQGCNIHSSVLRRGCSINITNFKNVVSLHTARKLAISNWITANDEFFKPDLSNAEYNDWNNDCVVFSLFSGQSSLRNISCCYKIWNIQNHFFWLQNELMKQLADDNGFDELYQDATVFNQERFVYQELQKIQLSTDAKEVLDKANQLVIDSIPERKRLHIIHPEWHLNAWDAGWYQIKKVLKESMKNDLDEFVVLYKKFEDRMREGVYKFGFLK